MSNPKSCIWIQWIQISFFQSSIFIAVVHSLFLLLCELKAWTHRIVYLYIVRCLHIILFGRKLNYVIKVSWPTKQSQRLTPKTKLFNSSPLAFPSYNAVGQFENKWPKLELDQNITCYIPHIRLPFPNLFVYITHNNLGTVTSLEAVHLICSGTLWNL